MDESTCLIEDCGAPKHGSTYCVKHYRRWKKYGDPLQSRPTPPPPAPIEPCSIDGCEKPVRIKSRGWCSPHYGRWRTHGDPEAGRLSRSAKPEECSVDQCAEPTRTKGLCSKHYYRAWRHGDPIAGRTPQGVPMEHYLTNVVTPTDDCRIWPYGKSDYGYGRLWINGRYVLVHDLACEWLHGPRPTPNHVASHGPCHDGSCWNPRHLSWQTKSQNAVDRIRDGTHMQGEQIAQAKLKEADVRAIRSRRAAGESLEGLAREFGIHPEHAGLIARRQKVWLHVP